MDAVNPWLDPSEVRHLAEQLLRPVAPARLSAEDPGFDASFVGFINQEKTSAPVEKRESGASHDRPIEDGETRSPASRNPEETPAAIIPAKIVSAEPSTVDSPQPPPVPSSQSRFRERIQIFRDWLEKNFEAKDIFILDREGKVIFDESGHGRLHFMARNLALASRGSGNIHVKIGPSAVLEVIPCETPYGRIVLGTMVPEALPSQHVRTITEVLVQTASPA